MGFQHKREFRLFSEIKSDLPSSIVVFFVALPLCLGIALASGAPLFSGIIAGIVGGIVVGMISNSAAGVSGPAAGLTVIVLASIEKLGSFEAFLLAVVLAGFIQILLGAIRAGTIGAFFPSSVIKGMLCAIGIIIVLKQIPHGVGYDADYEGDFSFIQADGENTFTELIRMLDSLSPGAVVVCALGLAVMLLWDTYVKNVRPALKLFQGPFVAVLVGVAYQLAAVAWFPGLSIGVEHLVQVPVADNISGFIAQFTLPAFQEIVRVDVWITAITIGIVASLETLLSVEATDKLDPHLRTTNRNRELIAQGSGNIVSGLIGGLPVTQVILRSSANIHSGARTKMSTILHGFMLLICVAMIPVVLNKIPLAALAAVLIMTGIKLINPAEIAATYRKGWQQFVPFMATVLGVVFTDLLIGIGIGVVVALIIILRNSYLVSHFVHRDHGGQKVRMTLAEEVFFLNKASIIREFENLRDGSHLTIDMSKSVHVDEDVMETIREFLERAPQKNISVDVIEKREKARKNRDELVNT
jgi:MFS superfamily sulfate permease-like transporter